MARESVVLISGDANVRTSVEAALSSGQRPLRVFRPDEDIRAVLADATTAVVILDGGSLLTRALSWSDSFSAPILVLIGEEEDAASVAALSAAPSPRAVDFVRRPILVAELRARIDVCLRLARAYELLADREKDEATLVQSLADQNRRVVTAQEEAESRVRTLQRYADFIESAADGIVVLDSSSGVLFANAQAQAVSGYSLEQLTRRKIREVFAPEDAERVRELRAGFARGEFPQGVDLRIVRPDARVVAISVNFNSVLREGGVVFCSFRDVTEERRIAAELIKTKDFLQRVIDSSADAIVSADLDGRIVLFNPAAERVYGYAASGIVGEQVTRLYPEGGAREVMKWVRAAGGRVEGIRTEILAASGQRIPVLLSAAMIHQGESPVGTVGIFTDLRDRMRMEQRLHEAQDQLLSQERQAIVAELAGAAAHELNQPLTSVMGYAELLKRRLEPSTPYFRAAEVIYAEADRMAEIVRKIGKITRYETKSYVGQARILDLDKASGGHSGNQGGAD